ncbi:hypothetical protein D3C86_2061980 [compost metagenome]
MIFLLEKKPLNGEVLKVLWYFYFMAGTVEGLSWEHFQTLWSREVIVFLRSMDLRTENPLGKKPMPGTLLASFYVFKKN